MAGVNERTSPVPARGCRGWVPLCRVVVRGMSMTPRLRDGDVLLVSRWSSPRPGAVVLARWPARPAQLSVKRVVGRHGTGWWVQGDDPAGSTDSRQLGGADVLGVAWMRLWPAPGLLRRRSGA